jgi:hypothetical protein
MQLRITIYAIFYAACFLLAIVTGVTSGFRGDSHTPPGSFMIESFLLPVGLGIFIIDAVYHKSTTVHKIGLTVNGLIMVYVLVLAFI